MISLNLPDIAAQTRQQEVSLDWVGMCGIALPLQLRGQAMVAFADVGVSLDDGESRGIHMSRLYLALAQLERKELSLSALRLMLDDFLHSHQDLSRNAYLSLTFDHLLSRAALVSPLEGWKRYPVRLDAQLKSGVFHVELFVEVLYSSTCPCSAALARQLIQHQFLQDFGERSLDSESILAWLGSSQGIVATPHSQRSVAKILVRLDPELEHLPITELIDVVEGALGTAVQTAVKRADEQAFALANGQNLMFCEDAARRLHSRLKAVPWSTAFNLRVEHAESLHAHNAVAASQWQW